MEARITQGGHGRLGFRHDHLEMNSTIPHSSLIVLLIHSSLSHLPGGKCHYDFAEGWKGEAIYLSLTKSVIIIWLGEIKERKQNNSSSKPTVSWDVSCQIVSANFKAGRKPLALWMSVVWWSHIILFITLKEKKILPENSHDNLEWSLHSYHYSPTLAHPFWQDLSLCFTKMPLESPILLSWLSQTNHQLSSKQCFYKTKMQIKASCSVPDLVAKSCIPDLSKIHPSHWNGGLQDLSTSLSPVLLLSFWTVTFLIQRSPCVLHMAQTYWYLILVARRIFTQNMKVCKTFHCITSRLIFVLLKAHPKESDSLRTSRTLQAELSLFFLLFWSQGGIVGIPTQREEFVAYFLGDMAQWGKCREYCSHLAFIQSKNAADGNIYGL